MRMRLYDGGSPLLPMIDQAQSKRDALYKLFWGLLYQNWVPDATTGSSVFLQAYDDRGRDNRRKKLFGSAMTPDLYADHYQRKIVDFFDLLFDDSHEGAPFMALVMANFVDLYWDLHVGVREEAIDDDVRSIFYDFVAVFSIANPGNSEFYTHYKAVRAKRALAMQWIAERIERVQQGIVPNKEDTFVYYWLANTGGGEASFTARDMAFECYTGFLAVSQWPLALYRIIDLLCGAEGASLRQQLKAALGAIRDPAEPYPPLDRFVMEILRLTCPNQGSISRPSAARSIDTRRRSLCRRAAPARGSGPDAVARPGAVRSDALSRRADERRQQPSGMPGGRAGAVSLSGHAAGGCGRTQSGDDQ